MKLKNKTWFTLVEIMVVVMVIWILASVLFMTIQPYMSRSRDTKRITDVQNYLNNIISSYDKNFDTFPSNYWSGGGASILGYCLSEISTRPDILAPGGQNGKDGYFTTLSKETSTPPSDPSNQTTYAPICSMTGSYIYSRMIYGTDSEIALIAAKLELKTSANYGTGADLTDVAKVQDLIMAKKSTVPDAATEQLYIVTALH